MPKPAICALERRGEQLIGIGRVSFVRQESGKRLVGMRPGRLDLS